MSTWPSLFELYTQSTTSSLWIKPHPTRFAELLSSCFRMVISSYWMSLKSISKPFWRCYKQVFVCIRILLCVRCYIVCMCVCNQHTKAKTPVAPVIVPFVITLNMNSSLHNYGLPKYPKMNFDLLHICILLVVNAFQSDFPDRWLTSQMYISCQSVGRHWSNTGTSYVSIVTHFNM